MILLCTNCGFSKSGRPYRSSAVSKIPMCTECPKRKGRTVHNSLTTGNEVNKVILVRKVSVRQTTGLLSIRRRP